MKITSVTSEMALSGFCYSHANTRNVGTPVHTERLISQPMELRSNSKLYIRFQPAVRHPHAQRTEDPRDAASVTAGWKEMRRQTSANAQGYFWERSRRAYHKHQNLFSCPAGHKMIVIGIPNERSALARAHLTWGATQKTPAWDPADLPVVIHTRCYARPQSLSGLELL